eukprot:6010504-Amphidinium_carterae.2
MIRNWGVNVMCLTGRKRQGQKGQGQGQRQEKVKKWPLQLAGTLITDQLSDSREEWALPCPLMPSLPGGL